MTALSHPYSRPSYASALGNAFAVPEWGTSVLLRAIPGTGCVDAAGCYPLTPFAATVDVDGGLARLRAAGAVSVVLVSDPIFAPPAAALANAFSLCRPFKTHFLVRRDRAAELPSGHRRNLQRARTACAVRPVELRDVLPNWLALYRGLVSERNVSGAAYFREGYFEALAELPDLTTIGAFAGEEMVAGSLWLHHEDVAYYHLGASNPAGYEARAMFAMFALALDRLRQSRVVNLGGNAGHGDDPASGLARFKRGFANADATTYLCGAVLDEDCYRRLGGPETTFFPRYRGSPATGE
jgi:Acetyltransferase (GNAT) domain